MDVHSPGSRLERRLQPRYWLPHDSSSYFFNAAATAESISADCGVTAGSKR